MSIARIAKFTSALFALSLLACEGIENSDPAVNTSTTPQISSHALVHFDFDNGNIYSEYIIPFLGRPVSQNFGPSDAPLAFYMTTTVATAVFDAIAPYSPTAVGFFSQLPRRPAAEGATNRYRNIALLYATYHAMSSVLPRNIQDWRAMVANVGLDPDDRSRDLRSPVGIGNTAGLAVVRARAHDGMNRDGNAGGKRYNLTPFADYTGYEPVNSALEIKDPSRWQPAVVKRGGGLYHIQKFVTPQYALTRAFSFDEVNDFGTPQPWQSDWQANPAAYKDQVDEVLQASAELTDYKKIAAEFFDNKFASLGRAGEHLRLAHNMSLEEFVHYDFAVQVAAFDAGIVMWKDKVKYDAVRPFTAIRYLYGNKRVRAWGGPGQGTVNNIRGDEWQSYLPVADHPEYPSGSACFCAAHAQASRRFIGSDQFNWSVVRPAGSSAVEPGITPAENLTLNFPTLTDFEQQCAMSRLWGGVHFRAAYEEAAETCRPIGDLAYELMEKHVNGRVHPRK